MRRGLGVMLSRRGIGRVLRNGSIAFAALSGIVQLATAIFPSIAIPGFRVLAGLLLLSFTWGALSSLSRAKVSQDFTNPEFVVTVKKGDIFSESDSWVVGFTDVFDTSTQIEDVISSHSVQAQLMDRLFEGSPSILDAKLSESLAGVAPDSEESLQDKPQGKRARYPIGTVAFMREGGRSVYGLAYSRMSNSLVAQSSVDLLWQSLNSLWESVAVNGRRQGLAMPVIGGDLARIDNIDHETLIKLIILSFVARSRRSVIASELTIVIHPENLDKVDVAEVRAFMASL
ncbi:macro domain-containing protein [Streptomyces sp. NPDC059810]|uniref:macro domain-containing protein n=1 Tax=Streptomyces sp. NPDC059810 TaxID=3346956 RepID=UPI00364F005F